MNIKVILLLKYKKNFYFLSALASLCSETTKTPGITQILIWEVQVKLWITFLMNYWALLNECFPSSKAHRQNSDNFIISTILIHKPRKILVKAVNVYWWYFPRCNISVCFSQILSVTCLLCVFCLSPSCSVDDVNTNPSSNHRQPSLLGDYPSDYRKLQLDTSLYSVENVIYLASYLLF